MRPVCDFFLSRRRPWHQISDRLETDLAKLSTIKTKVAEKDTSFGNRQSCFRPSAAGWRHTCTDLLYMFHPDSNLKQSNMLVKSCLPGGEYSYSRIFENIEKPKSNNFVATVSETIIKRLKYPFLHIPADYVLLWLLWTGLRRTERPIYKAWRATTPTVTR